MSGLPPLDHPGGHRWPVVLEYGPMTLRPLQRSDRRAWTLVRRRNWGWLERWEPTVPPGTDARAMDFGDLLRAHRIAGRDGTGMALAVEWREGTDSLLIGQVNVAGIVRSSAQSAQIGYWIDQWHAGRGITPLAVAVIGDYCFQVLRLHRLEIVIRPENLPSLRVVEKLGFRDEGFRPGYLHIDGAWRDHRVFALNVDEVPEGLLARCPVPRW